MTPSIGDVIEAPASYFQNICLGRCSPLLDVSQPLIATKGSSSCVGEQRVTRWLGDGCQRLEDRANSTNDAFPTSVYGNRVPDPSRVPAREQNHGVAYVFGWERLRKRLFLEEKKD